jgi:uncharacterized membrane protein YtjA (UPF0391 family)
MFHWALMFLIIAVTAALLGMNGIAGIATNIAWILFVTGLLFALIYACTERRPHL